MGRARHVALVAMLGGVCSVGSGDRLHMLFWQPEDVLDAEGVTYEAEPFLQARFETLVEKPEGRPGLWHMPVAAIPVEGGLRVYYQRVEKDAGEWVQQRTLCLGILTEDGFERPDLGLYAQTWDGPRNVVMQRSPHTPTWGGFNVHQIVRDPPGEYVMLYWDQPAEGSAGAMLARSPDGIHWEKDPQGPVFTELNDAYTLRREDDGYVVYQTALLDWPEKPYPDNLAGRRRVQTIRRSPDLVHWTPQELMLAPDEWDGEAAELYLLKTFRHVDRYVGLLMKYYANPARPNRHSDIVPGELIFSRDGVHWARPYRDTDFGLWTYADPFELGGDLCMVGHHDGCLVLARTRRDRLASVGAAAWGSFRTPPFDLPSGGLRLNAGCRFGTIEVELIARGATVAECALVGADGVALPLRWSAGNLQEVAGTQVELRFRLANARVYALTDGE